MQPRVLVAFFAVRVHLWLLMFSLVSTRTPRSYSPKLLPRWSAPSLSWCMGLLLPTQHFPMLNIMWFPLAHFSSFQGPPEEQHTLQPFCVICRLAEGALCPILQVAKGVVEQYWIQNQALLHIPMLMLSLSPYRLPNSVPLHHHLAGALCPEGGWLLW